MNKILLKSILIISILSIKINSQNLEVTDESFQFPSLIFQNSKGKNINSDANGIVTKIVRNKDDKILIFIKTNITYFYKNTEVSETYNLIYGNLSKVFVQENEKIGYGNSLGLCEPECYVTSSFEKLSPFPVRMSQRKALKFDNHFLFTPDWINRKNTNFLSFRNAPSLQKYLTDYFNRWKKEKDSPSDYTIFHTNSIDRIQFQIKLTEIPNVTKRNEALLYTEEQIYSTQNLFFTENTINSYKISGYTPVIFWQKNYDQYLKEEYKLNTPLYIYASVTTIDHINKRIYICARDFTLIDNERVINDRLAEYEKF
ncbi:hypothetical protein [Leptospira brenneri]|uniref:hypothetical protein n=1 Tax=Leptospira brenneri TaxID=2023182 RepID=UPI000C2A93FE|nr:hypothetical protein [Leptospira brenneri]PJZ43799.1 hypothetical protein CH361_18780 [Leptospira brenneri]